ncbi:MAG TPA: DnaJ domain-containing protein [Nitrososphaeraceae archaeon]|nr:DnaJ domain-containing protein [Nitrososphaeraceae archaeon]
MDIYEYYQTLSVGEDATPQEIKKAYRFMVRKYHPDRNSKKENDTEMIKKINIAFEVLSDEKKRKDYDNLCFESQNLDSCNQKGSDVSPKNIYKNHEKMHETSIRKKFNIEESRFKIIVEPSLCMAFGSCAILAPHVFHIESNKMINPKAIVISETADKFESILDAAQTCPTKAIIIIDKHTGKQIFP